MKVGVIGAGASGMSAALHASWNGADVTLFERNLTVGRKLLVTGSGRCNISNDSVSPEKYFCADPAWMEKLINCFGVRDLLDMLADIGVPVYKTSDGWYYPLSESAHSVVSAFSSAMEVAGVALKASAQVTCIQPQEKGFLITFFHDQSEQRQEFERIVISTGGKAYPSLGSRGELFSELKRLGHTVLPIRPALAPVIAELGNLQPLQGVRMDAGVTLWEGSRRVSSTLGNMIFTQWGLNGPAVMDLSHHISANPDAEFQLSLNLLAPFQEAFDLLLAHKRTSRMPLRILLGAFFPPKVVLLFLQNANIAKDISLCDISDSTIERVLKNLTDTRVSVKGLRGYEYCQMSAGGVPVNEVDVLTMESHQLKGLFLTGEILDVVGPCGGYNLQFALSSGALAGKAAARPG